MKVFASCDSAYFIEHAPAWYYSALKAGYTPVVEVVNPNDKVKKYVERRGLKNIHYIEVENPSKPFLCSNRFFSAEKYLDDKGLLITDIDCYFNGMPKAWTEDVGLYFRPENPDHMKIAAGIVWLSGSDVSREFIQHTGETIRNLADKWFVDQIALLMSWLVFRKKAKFFHFNSLHMDWEFNEGSYMWTGKGPRKYENETYLSRKAEIEAEIS